MGKPVSSNFRYKLLAAALMSASLAACGGGGSGGSDANNSSSSSSSSSSGGSSGTGSSGSSSSSSSGSSSGGTQNSAPQITSLTIGPSSAYTDTNLSADIVTTDEDGDALDKTYAWHINGTPLESENTRFLNSKYFVKGDQVRVTATVTDGKESVSSSAQITIDNRAPEISAYAPSPVQGNRIIILQGAAQDADGDVMTYSWAQLSGEPVDLNNPEQLTPSFTSPVVFGELVFQFTATDIDGLASSNQVSVIIENAPPTINQLTLSPQPAFTDTDLTATVESSDADSQALLTTYRWYVNDKLLGSEVSSTLPSQHFSKNDQVSLEVEVSDGELKATRSASVTINDSPATITISGAPETAEYGVPVTFTVTTEDADDDAIELKFNARPNSMAMDEDGIVTWTPTGPMFDTSQDVYWEITSVQEGTSNTVGGTIRVEDEDRLPPLARSSVIVNSNMQNAFTSGDFNGDGTQELLLTDLNQRLYTVAYDGSGYEQNWMYPYALTETGGRISSIAAGDMDGDGIDEIFVGLNDYYGNDNTTQILIIDGSTRLLRDFISVDGRSVSAIRIADVNNDGQNEIVYLLNLSSYSSGDHKVEVRKASDFSLLWQSSTLASQTALAIGDTDDDETQEIVLSGGYIFGFNGSTFVNEWLYADGFGYRIEVADVDGDGVDDIVGRASANDQSLAIFDAVNKTVKGEIAENFKDLALSDVDGDNKAEILAFPNYGNEARLYSFDKDATPQFSLDWSLSLPRNAAKGLIGDTDGDDQQEFIALFEYGTPILIAGNNPEIGIEWQGSEIYEVPPPFGGGELANFNGKGNRVVFFAQGRSDTPSYSYGMRAIQMDPVDGSLEWSPALSNSSGYFYGTLTDQGQDGTIELLYSSYQTPSVYSFFSESVIWTAPNMSDRGKAVAKGKLNADQEDDLVILTTDGTINAYDPKNQVLLWGVDRESGNTLTVADLDADTKNQVIVSDNNSISVYLPGEGSATLELNQTLADIAPSLAAAEDVSNLANSEITKLATGDLDGDGKQEVIFTASYYSDYSWLVVLNHDLSPRKAVKVNGWAQNILVQNYGTGHRNILVNVATDRYSNAQSNFVEIDPESGVVVSKSPTMLYMQPSNSMYFVDTDGNGVPELSYGTQYSINVTR